MAPEVTLIAVFAVPIVLLMVLRVNAALIFLSLCLGDVLVQFAGKDATSIVTGASLQAHTTDNMVKLAVLLLPAVLTLVFMIRTVRGPRLMLNLLPALAVGILTLLLATPLLPPGLSTNIQSSAVWHDIRNLQSVLVSLSAAVCLLFLWLRRSQGSREHAKHR